MLDFKLNEENYFEFEMQITGDADTSEKPIVEFALEIKNGIKMSFLAEKKDSIYCVTLPPLKEFLSSGEHDFKLDVFLGDKFFTPYSGKCTFKEAAKPVISNIKVESKEQVKQPIVPTITFTQKDKVPVLVDSLSLASIIMHFSFTNSSPSTTSRPTPATFEFLRAKSNACVSISSPRAVLIMYTLSFISENAYSFKIRSVSGVSGA
jgi:hypothetical protein